jgi:hypothetical protein
MAGVPALWASVFACFAYQRIIRCLFTTQFSCKPTATGFNYKNY